jgi:hypothetical protein
VTCRLFGSPASDQPAADDSYTEYGHFVQKPLSITIIAVIVLRVTSLLRFSAGPKGDWRRTPQTRSSEHHRSSQ